MYQTVTSIIFFSIKKYREDGLYWSYSTTFKLICFWLNIFWLYTKNAIVVFLTQPLCNIVVNNMTEYRRESRSILVFLLNITNLGRKKIFFTHILVQEYFNVFIHKVHKPLNNFIVRKIKCLFTLFKWQNNWFSCTSILMSKRKLLNKLNIETQYKL